MKTFARIRKFGALALVLAVSAIVYSCASWYPSEVPIPPEVIAGKPRISIKDGGIIVPRALEVTPEELKRLNAALAEHDKSLYKVAYYEGGKRTDLTGTLNCISNAALKIVDAAAAKNESSNVAVQFSPKTSRPKPTPTPSPGPGENPGGSRTCYVQQALEDDAEELRKKVLPILRRYSRQ